MHILMITPGLPYPPHQGGAIRNYGLIENLRQAGHEISLVSFQDDRTLDVRGTPLAGLCSQIATVPLPARSSLARLRDLVFSGQPDLVRRLYSDEFRDCLVGVLQAQQFDLIQFEGLEMCAYLADVRQHQPAAKLCYDAHNAEYRLQEVIFEIDRAIPARWPAAFYSFVQARRITYFERAVCQEADCVIAVSEEDAAALRALRGHSRVGVVPNGITVSQYAAPAEQLDLGEYALVFTGKMDYRPNVDAMEWFAHHILPQVKAVVPETRLYIVGQKPHPRLERLRDLPGVEITGWVRDVRPFLQAAGVYVAPLRMGSGTRLKILEAMAAGCAVVATPTAAAGMTGTSEQQALIIREGQQQLANAVIELLRDPQQRRQIGAAARAYVQKHYDWPVLIPRLLNTYKECGIG